MSEQIKIAPCEDPTLKEELKFKVVIVGDSGVGKTNLVRRFINNVFTKDTKATVGVEFMSKNFIVDNKVIKLELWDTAGQERYKAITAAYYRGAKGAMIVYDVTSKDSFNNVDKWHNELKTKGSQDINIIMIGNKTDLEDIRHVSSEQGQEKAHFLQIPIMETSALDASNVKESFNRLIQEMYLSVFSKSNDNNKTEKIEEGVSLKVEKNKEEEKKGCC